MWKIFFLLGRLGLRWTQIKKALNSAVSQCTPSGVLEPVSISCERTLLNFQQICKLAVKLMGVFIHRKWLTLQISAPHPPRPLACSWAWSTSLLLAHWRGAGRRWERYFSSFNDCQLRMHILIYLGNIQTHTHTQTHKYPIPGFISDLLS